MLQNSSVLKSDLFINIMMVTIEMSSA